MAFQTYASPPPPHPSEPAVWDSSEGPPPPKTCPIPSTPWRNLLQAGLLQGGVITHSHMQARPQFLQANSKKSLGRSLSGSTRSSPYGVFRRHSAHQVDQGWETLNSMEPAMLFWSGSSLGPPWLFWMIIWSGDLGRGRAQKQPIFRVRPFTEWP